MRLAHHLIFVIVANDLSYKLRKNEWTKFFSKFQTDETPVKNQIQAMGG